MLIYTKIFCSRSYVDFQKKRDFFKKKSFVASSLIVSGWHHDAENWNPSKWHAIITNLQKLGAHRAKRAEKSKQNMKLHYWHKRAEERNVNSTGKKNQLKKMLVKRWNWETAWSKLNSKSFSWHLLQKHTQPLRSRQKLKKPLYRQWHCQKGGKYLPAKKRKQINKKKTSKKNQ